MKLIKLIVLAKEKKLNYIAIDQSRKVFGFFKKPKISTLFNEWINYNDDRVYLGKNKSICWNKSLININDLKLTVLEKYNA